MFRVLEVAAAGPTVITQGDAGVVPPPPGSPIVRWIDLEGSDEASLALLRARFGFHPLAIEDCLHFDQRPKLEEYGEYLFVVIHGLTCPGDAAKVEFHELHAFLGPGYLVTVHDEPIPMLESTWRRLEGDAALARRGADFIYYLIADATVDANFPILDTMSDVLEDIENAVIQGAHRRDLARIFELKRTLVTMRKVLSPQRDVFALLAKRGDARVVSERTAFYLRDVYDHLVRIYEAIDTGRDLLGNALDAYLSMVANRTNEIMKRLTIMSAIFLPLTFVTGFFGQNFTHLPFGSDALMYAMIAVCVVLPASMVVWFLKSGWL